MVLEFHDLVGFSGAGIILVTYLFLQVKKMSSESLLYSILNLVGAALILFSLTYAWNLTAIVMEVIWGAVSLFGIVRWYKLTHLKSN